MRGLEAGVTLMGSLHCTAVTASRVQYAHCACTVAVFELNLSFAHAVVVQVNKGDNLVARVAQTVGVVIGRMLGRQPLLSMHAGAFPPGDQALQPCCLRADS